MNEWFIASVKKLSPHLKWTALKKVEGEGLQELGGLRVERCGPRAEGDEHHVLSGQVRAGVPGSLYISRIKHGDTT